MLCTLTPPLASPPPAYDAAADAVVCHHGVTFGRGPWALPPVCRPLPAAAPAGVPAREAVFGAALLGGGLGGPAWRSLAPLLAAAPSGLLSAAGMAQARCVELLHALSVRGVVSRATLAAAWRVDPVFLRREVLLWVQRDARAEVLQQWPRLVAEVLSGAEVGGKKGKRKKKKTIS